MGKIYNDASEALEELCRDGIEGDERRLWSLRYTGKPNRGLARQRGEKPHRDF